jgi:nucleotide-binding universal stress UspA family protein
VNTPRVVVGVDGSPGCRAALQWAATQASRRGVELLVVHAFDWQAFGGSAPVGSAYVREATARAEALVDAAVDEARGFAPGVNVRGQVLLGRIGSALMDAAAADDLLVVGGRGLGGFTGLLLGSVSQRLATHAAGPVVVVRGRPDATGPVVVGADGSDGSRDALAVAFEEAATRASRVVAVRAYTPFSQTWQASMAPYAEDPDERRAAEQRALVEDLRPWQRKFPEVDLDCVVEAGHATAVLAGRSGTAQLLVIGTRGHGGLDGLLLGSVGLGLLHHAECPVMIVRGSR